MSETYDAGWITPPCERGIIDACWNCPYEPECLTDDEFDDPEDDVLETAL